MESPPHYSESGIGALPEPHSCYTFFQAAPQSAALVGAKREDCLSGKFDFLLGVCDSKQWLNRCNMLPLGRYKKMCAVCRDHPLAKKECLEFSDLYGETLMMVKEGDSATNDLLRNDLRENHPAIRIEDTPQFYDMSVFNRCIETGNVLLMLECWQDVHPALIRFSPSISSPDAL